MFVCFDDHFFNDLSEGTSSVTYDEILHTYLAIGIVGALHTGPWIQCRSGIRIQGPLCIHMAFDLDLSCVVLCDSAREQCVIQSNKCNTHNLRIEWSSPKTILNPDRGSGSCESFFSAHVKSLTICDWKGEHAYCLNMNPLALNFQCHLSMTTYFYDYPHFTLER